MDFCKTFSGVFKAVRKDPRICITHIGLFATLVEYWQTQGCPQPLEAFAHEIMPLAKILASTTYHRCIRDLHDLGYILYEPSYKRNERSKIYLKTEMSEDE